MKVLNSFFVVLLIFALFGCEQETKNYTAKEAFDLMKTIDGIPFERTTSPEAQWFPDAGLGLFMHWGIHSVAALDPSWTMIKNCPWADDCYAVGSENYYRLLEEFNPSAYDPDKWIAAAKQAGFQYAVLTTKHHDGFCLWPSEYGELNTKKYMDGRDLLLPYVEACRKYGLKVGFYFSPRDWGNPVYPIPYPDYDFSKKDSAKGYPDEINQEKFDEFFDTTVGQLSEILTRYGKIDLLWFDGVDWPGVDVHSDKLHAWLRAIQPEMVINPRWQGSNDVVEFGDYKAEEMDWGGHPEMMPDKVNKDDWWEFCDSWTGSWGYSPMSPYKDLSEIFKILAYARSFGGNYLVNIGPAPDGTMRPGYYRECMKLADWMENNKEAVIGAKPVYNWQEFSNVPLTKNGNCYYAHVLKDHKGVVTMHSVGKPLEVVLLSKGKQLGFEYSEKDGISIYLDETDREKLDDVIKFVFPEK